MSTNQGFSGKENIKMAMYNVIGAVYTITRSLLVQINIVNNGKEISVSLKQPHEMGTVA